MVKKLTKPRKPKKSSSPPIPPQPPSDGGGDGGGREERPEFYAIRAVLMSCTPVNYDGPKGEPASVVTIARKDAIEPLVFSMDDTRKLVTKLLVSLATYGDEHAEKVLDEMFPADSEGNFIWPNPLDSQP
ncbi:MAG TPA: hypothetical protein VF796_06265 [Humisphaera sp.]